MLIAWPHEGTDWCARLLETESSYVALVSVIARFERVLVCVPDDAVRERAVELLGAGGADLSKVRFVEIPYDDTWLRDSGPLTLRGAHEFTLADFRACAKSAMMKRGRAEAIVEEICDAVSKWPDYAEQAQVMNTWRKQIQKNLRLDLLKQ